MSRLISSCQFTKHDFCDYLFGFNFFFPSSHEQMYKNDFFIIFFGFNLPSFRKKIKKNFSMTGNWLKNSTIFLLTTILFTMIYKQYYLQRFIDNIIYNDL